MTPSLAQATALLRSGRAGDPASAVSVLEDAAAAGDAEAGALAAVLAGAGVAQPQDWRRAFDHLERAARAGSASAQAQLEMLGDHARALAYWLAPPAKQSLSDSPRIRAIPGFLPLPVCDWMMRRALPALHAAQVYDPASGRATLEGGRTNREVDFDICDADVVLLLVRARIAAVTGLPTAVMELTKVLHYAPGQRFEPHFDFLDPAVPGFEADLRARGQRIATLLVYLNGGYEGGETAFPVLGLRHKGAAGDALLFANTDAAGTPDRRTLHAGLPPGPGEKWLLSQWIRDRTPA